MGGRNQSQRVSLEMARVELGQEPGSISTCPGAEGGDTRREAQRKLWESVKSCTPPKRGRKQHAGSTADGEGVQPGSRAGADGPRER